MQKALINENNVAIAFKDDTKFDWVVNLAAETRFGQEVKAYEQMVKKFINFMCKRDSKTRCRKIH